MAKKGSLFLLVKSLTMSEKRYFKLFAAGARDANYLRLFDFIDSQKELNEEEVKEHFKNAAFVRQLHVTKIYLSDLILRSLRNYYADDTIQGQLLDLLRDIEILFRKELYDACLYKIAKAEKIAVNYEKGALLAEVLGWKRKLMVVKGSIGGKSLDEILDREKDTLEKLLSLNRYWSTTFHLFENIKDKSFVKKLDIKNASTLQALSLHQHLLYSYHFMNGNLSEAEKEIAQLIRHLEQLPHRVEDDPGTLVTAIGNKIGLLLAQKRWKETESLISEMRAVPEKYKLNADSKFTVRLWLRIFNLELEVYRDTRQLQKGTILIREVESYLDSREDLIPDNYRIMLFYQITGIWFMKNNFSKALYWVNKIVNANFGETRIEIQCYARFLNLMIHFELDNILVLRYAVDSCRRFLKKKKSVDPFGQEVLQLFAKLSLAASGEYKTIFRKFHDVVYVKENHPDDKFQDYIDLKAWVIRKMR